MYESEHPAHGTSPTPSDGTSVDDSSRQVGVNDGQPTSPSPTVGQPSPSDGDDGGQPDVVTEDDTPLDLRQQVRTPEHVLGTQAVSEILGAAMFPRSQRSIERYCQSGKLDAFFDENTRTYWITRASVHEFIDELRRNELAQQSTGDTGQPYFGDDVRRRRPVSSADGHGGATVTDDGGHSSSGPTSHEPDVGSSELEQLKQTLKRKEQEIIDLTITNRAKDEFMARTKDQFHEFLDRLTESTKRVGELESENRLLKELPPGRSAGDPEVHRESSGGDHGDN